MKKLFLTIMVICSLLGGNAFGFDGNIYYFECKPHPIKHAGENLYKNQIASKLIIDFKNGEIFWKSKKDKRKVGNAFKKDTTPRSQASWPTEKKYYGSMYEIINFKTFEDQIGYLLLTKNIYYKEQTVYPETWFYRCPYKKSLKLKTVSFEEAKEKNKFKESLIQRYKYIFAQ